MDPFLGQIILFAGNFAPRGWALCEGQILAINQNQALFSLLGTTYGGDGRTSFALPDMRGRAPVSQGDGAGLSNRALGAKGGTQTNVITTAHMPAHAHVVGMPVNTNADSAEETSGFLASSSTNPIYNEEQSGSASYSGVTCSNNGGGQSINNLQPFLGLNYIIALIGSFPSRS